MRFFPLTLRPALIPAALVFGITLAAAQPATGPSVQTETAPPPPAPARGGQAASLPSTAELEALTGGKPIPPGPFRPEWESIEANYDVPEWFLDGKFGIFLHWGVYSVPGRQSEWYVRHMYGTPGIIDWHRHTYGPPDQFGYKDFIPLFTAERFNAAEWADLFRRAGAKYVIPTAEHHDGFALWDSDLTRWDSMEMGPKRDLMGELAAALRQEGLKFGVSNHRIEHFDFIRPREGLATDLTDPRWADFYSVADRSPEARLRFLNDWLARNFELIDKYQPDMLWFDNGVNSRLYDPLKLKVAAYYYNRAREWGKQVSLSTKRDAYLHGSILDFERGHPADIKPGTWQTDNTVHHRWGYLNDTLYRSVGTLVRELIDNVSKNGNLLLNFAPKADGTFPEEQVAILLGMGKWLDLNGEAIYGTRHWTKFGEGPTQFNNPENLDETARIHREAVGDIWLPTYTGSDFRFTTKGHTLYAIAMAWPHLKATITSLATGAAPAGRITAVELLGHGPVAFTQDAEGLKLTLPVDAPCEHAFVFKITGLQLQ